MTCASKDRYLCTPALRLRWGGGVRRLRVLAGVPGPVSGIVATPGIDSATVQWTVPATPAEVTKYTIVATPTSGNAAPVTAVSPSPTSLIGPLSANTSWNFTVTAGNVNGSGPPASTSAPTTPLSSTSASFSGYTDYPLASGGNLSYASIAHADLRGNGRQDLIVGGSAGVNVFFSKGNGTFWPDHVYDPGRAYFSVAVADLNGDGIPDIIATNYPTSDTVSILPGRGNGTFGPPTVINVGVGSYAYTLAVADLNGDGHADFVVGTDTAVVPFLNNGSGSFAGGTPQPYMVGKQAVTVNGRASLAIGDIDGDGTPDVISSEVSSGCGYFNPNCVGADIFTGTPGGMLNPASFLVLGSDPEEFEKILLADVNGDGSLDIIAMTDGRSCTQGYFRVFYNNGSGGFTRGPTSGPNCSADIAVGDMNGDGALDVVTASSGCFNSCPYNDQLGRVELGWGDGNFALASAELPTFQFARVATADLNGDGLPDVAATNGSVLRIILNTTPDQWAPAGGWLNAYNSFGGGFFCPACALQEAEHNALGMRGDPVDTATGNFYQTFSDFNIPGRGQPLLFTHTYNSQAGGVNGPLGYGFSFAYSDHLSFASNGVVTYSAGTGAQATFTPVPGTGSYSTSPHTLATLTRSGTGYVLTQYGQLTLSFNSSGQLTRETDRNGYATRLSYHGSRLSRITDNAGRSLSVGWTGSHITSVTDNNVSPPRIVRFGYHDTDGDLTQVTDVNGGVTRFGYDTAHPWQHLITTITDPRRNVTTNAYDQYLRVTSQTDGRGSTTTFGYGFDSSGNATVLVTDPPVPPAAAGNQQLETFRYGLLTSVVKGYGTASAAAWTTRYDPVTLTPVSATDPNGHTTSYVTDPAGDTVRTTDALGRVTTAAYNSLHEPLTETDGNRVTTTYRYDPRGNVTSVSRPLLGTKPLRHQRTRYIYGDARFPGDVTQVINPDGQSAYFHYDKYGYRDEVKDPLGHVTATEHNADGWVIATFSAKAHCTWNSSPPAGCSRAYETRYSYNPFGEVTRVTDPLGHVTKITYDKNGNKVTFQDGNQSGHACQSTGTSRECTTYTYNADDQLTVVTRADGTIQVTDYNPDGTVKDLKDGEGHVIISYRYNALAQATSTTDALGNVTAYTYDGAGNLLTKTNPGGSCTGTVSHCTTYTYDAASQLKTISYSDSPAENVTNISYDRDGQRTSMTDGTGTSSWTYDSLNRLTSNTNGYGATVTYGYTYGPGPTYDLQDQARSITYPHGAGTVTQAWDANGRLISVTDWHGKTVTFSYDANGNQTSQTTPSATKVTDTFGYNAADQMTSISDSNGSMLFSASYARDSNGQITTDNSQNSNQSAYKYTSLNQLCYAGRSSRTTCSSPPANSYRYAFDKTDNLTTNNGMTQKYSRADELCWTYHASSSRTCASAPVGATNYKYDNRGNRTSEVPPNGLATCYIYDQANRLTKIQAGTGPRCSAPKTVGTYSYDGNGIRESKTVLGKTTQFTWDGAGENLLQQQAGSAMTSFIYGPDGIPVEQIVGSTAKYLHHDQLGSIRLITDTAGASRTATKRAWSPFGGRASQSGPFSSPFGFSGQYADLESGFIYLRNRYYDPATAQFLTVDPMVSSTRSPYGYVTNNPVNLTDFSGLGCDWWNVACDAATAGSAVVGTAGDWVSTAASGAGDLWNATGGQVVHGAQQLLNTTTNVNYGAFLGGFFNFAYGTTTALIGAVGVVGGTAVSILGIEVPPVSIAGASVSLGGIALFGIGWHRIGRGFSDWDRYINDAAHPCNHYTLQHELGTFFKDINPLPWPR